jgi:hypothetical protein
MHYVSEAWRQYQRHRFMRQDAGRFRKPDPARYVSGSKQFYDVLYGRKYRADQLRHPAGSSEGGGRFAPEGGGSSGGGSPPKVRLAFAGPAAAGARATVQLGLMLYTYMSAQNGPDKQAIVTFRARKFEAENGILDLESAQNFSRDEVEQVCPRLDEVQRRADLAAEVVTGLGRQLTPKQYGTAVHSNLNQQIKKLHDPNFVAEKSFIKERDEAQYGEKGSIRVDVLESVGNGTVCVYDIKTGKTPLDRERMSEIASHVFVRYPATRRIVVSEIRPQK